MDIKIIKYRFESDINISIYQYIMSHIFLIFCNFDCDDALVTLLVSIFTRLF